MLPQAVFMIKIILPSQACYTFYILVPNLYISPCRKMDFPLWGKLLPFPKKRVLRSANGSRKGISTLPSKIWGGCSGLFQFKEKTWGWGSIFPTRTKVKFLMKTRKSSFPFHRFTAILTWKWHVGWIKVRCENTAVTIKRSTRGSS